MNIRINRNVLLLSKIAGTVVLIAVSITSAIAQSSNAPIAKMPYQRETSLNATSTDSLSYALGVQIAYTYKAKPNLEMLNQAINDVEELKTPLMTVDQMRIYLWRLAAKLEKLKKDSILKAEEPVIEANNKAASAFLLANQRKPGVVTTPSGLQYKVITAGHGAIPICCDYIKCQYEGRLMDGAIFDSSYAKNKISEFFVNGVIPGLSEALKLMPVGSRWRIFIPPNLAYGNISGSPKIPPASLLIFDLELLGIANK